MKRNTTTSAAGALALLAMLLTVGCQTAPRTEAARSDLENDAQAALSRMQAADETLEDIVDRGRGYVIFPNAGKGAFVVGGGYGRGVVYEQDRLIGYADITQLSVGPQIGGQAFSELIVFQTDEALDRFKNNRLTFGANASAVIVKAGAAATASSQDGALVFVMPKAGAMAELSISGQRFTYTSAQDVPGGAGGATTRQAQRASDTEAADEAERDRTETETSTVETRTETTTQQRRNTD